MDQLDDVAIVLALGGVLGWLSQRLNFPNAVAQVVLGVILGAAFLGWVVHGDLLHVLGEIGVVLLLGVAGLELGIERLKAAGLAGVAVAVLGIVLSTTAGYLIGYLNGSPSDEAVYIGLALGATSIGMTVQVLQQFGLIGQRVADTVIAAAVIDDVIVLYLLGAAHGLLGDGLSMYEVLTNALLAFFVLAGLFALCMFSTKLLQRRGMITNRWLRGIWILVVVSLSAVATHLLELSSVVGAFFAGVGLGEALENEQQEQSVSFLSPLVLIMMPFFFVMIGVQAEWDSTGSPGLVWFVTASVIVAVATKALAGLIGAGQRFDWSERWLIGLGMVPRGEVGLVIVTLGMAQGHLSRAMFVALVATIILVSAIGPLAMAPVAKQLALRAPQTKEGISWDDDQP